MTPQSIENQIIFNSAPSQAPSQSSSLNRGKRDRIPTPEPRSQTPKMNISKITAPLSKEAHAKPQRNMAPVSRSTESVFSVEWRDQGSRTIPELTAQLTRSLRRPTSRTLTLIEKALNLLTPFESAKATPTSPHERQALLDLLTTHRLALDPYLNTAQVESHLRY